MDDRAYWWNQFHFPVNRQLTSRDGSVILPDVTAFTAMSIVCCFIFGKNHPLVTSTKDALDILCRKQGDDAPKKPSLKRRRQSQKTDVSSSADEEEEGQPPAAGQEIRTANPNGGEIFRLSRQRLQHATELCSRLDLILLQPLDHLAAHEQFHALPLEWRKVFPMCRSQRT